MQSLSFCPWIQDRFWQGADIRKGVVISCMRKWQPCCCERSGEWERNWRNIQTGILRQYGDGVSMEKIRNLSLKKTMVYIRYSSLIVTFSFFHQIIEIAGQIQERSGGSTWDEYYQAMNNRTKILSSGTETKSSKMNEWTGIFRNLWFSFRRIRFWVLFLCEMWNCGQPVLQK